MDEEALSYFRSELAKCPHDSRWWLHCVLLEEMNGVCTLIGTTGYKGPPSEDGHVEIGYGIIESRQRQGYATLAVSEIVRRAFVDDRVTVVAAETLVDLAPSRALLRKCGFQQQMLPDASPIIRYEIKRDEHSCAASPFPPSAPADS
jgi:RimJ/RimL family protein N-acetyltransferase